MPARRASVRRGGNRITPVAVDAYCRSDEIALRHALDLKPWMPSPIGGVGPSPWPSGTAGCEFWAQAVELREQIEAEVPTVR